MVGEYSTLVVSEVVASRDCSEPPGLCSSLIPESAECLSSKVPCCHHAQSRLESRPITVELAPFGSRHSRSASVGFQPQPVDASRHRSNASKAVSACLCESVLFLHQNSLSQARECELISDGESTTMRCCWNGQGLCGRSTTVSNNPK